jgi:hypothetical protein
LRCGSAAEGRASLADGTKVTVFFRKPPLRESGLLPRGGIARFYGTAKIYKSGPIYEEIWNRLIEPDKKGDPEKKGFGVLIKVERAQDLSGTPARDLTSPPASQLSGDKRSSAAIVHDDRG